MALFTGGETTPIRAVVQSAGYAYRLAGAGIRQEFSRGGATQELTLRDSQGLLTQMAQTGVCECYAVVRKEFN